MAKSPQRPQRPLGPATFEQQLQKVSAFFRPENLNDATLRYEGELAFIAVCPQGAGRNIADKIALLTAEFRAAGIAICGGYDKQSLKSSKRKLLLLCGTDLADTLRTIALDAKSSGYEVCLLRDLSESGKGIDKRKESLNAMIDAGVVIENSSRVLSALKKSRRIEKTP